MSEGVQVRQRTGAATSTGPRPHNEDSFLVQDASMEGGRVVVAVADGMGGHAAGDVASRLAIETAIAGIDAGVVDHQGMEAVFVDGDGRVRGEAGAQGVGSMGTTLTAAVVEHGEAVIGHIGDTRAYLFHNGVLQQITDDHSRVGRMVRDGVISEDEAMHHPEQNILERALGVGDSPAPDVYRVGMGPGDILFLSTDGLHGVVPRGEIEQVLSSSTSLQEACNQLVALAEAWGTDDNVTAVAWQYPAGDDVTEHSGGGPPTLIGVGPRLAGRSQPAGFGGEQLFALIGLLVTLYVLGFGVGYLLGGVFP